MKGKIVALLGIIGFILLVMFLSTDKTTGVIQLVWTGEVATGINEELELQEIRDMMAENDVAIMRAKKIKEDAQKEVDEATQEIERSRESNRELEQRRVQIINWAEQEVIYESTGAATSGESFQ